MPDATKSTTSDLVAGIMGGMGPEATADFFSKLVSTNEAQTDQDHIRVLIDNNPRIPNRHAAIRGEAPSVAPQLIDMARRLETAGADFVVMVCNTAHAYERDIRGALCVPFVSIIEEVASHIVQAHGRARSVGVMAADGCLEAKLYQDSLARRGLEPVLWDTEELSRFMALVYRIKAGERSDTISAAIKELALVLANRGADLIIGGCTEIPLVLDPASLDVPFISSSDLLVSRTIDYAKGLRPLPIYS